MRIAMVDKSSCVISNDFGDTIPWSLAGFDKTRFSEVEEPFKEINDFLSTLSPTQRSNIWNCYLHARQVFTRFRSILTEREYDDVATRSALTLINEVTEIVTAMYVNINLAVLERWLDFYGTVIYPDNLISFRELNDKNPDRTYTFAEYKGLVVLTIALKPMVPIWGEFIELIEKESGNIHKEFFALRLLSKTEILQHDYVSRLLRYIESQFTKDVDCSAAILTTMSSEVIPEWLLSMCLVRRMAIGAVNSSETKGSIISNVYVFIFNILKDIDKRFGGLREKYPESDDSPDGREEGSLLELYNRQKQTLTIGDEVVYNVCVENIQDMVLAVDDTVPAELIEAYRQMIPYYNQSSTINITDNHLTIIQWILYKAVSAHIIPCLSKPNLINALVAAQILATHWGFDTIALLLSSSPRPPGDDAFISTPGRPTTESVRLLNIYYPHALQAESGSRNANPAYLAIMTLAREIRKHVWTVSGPEFLLNKCSSVIAMGQLRLLPEMAEQFARLVIKTNQLLGEQ